MTKIEARNDGIKAALHLRGSSYSDIARQIEVTTSAVSLVARGRSRSKRIEEAIAQQVGVEPHLLWPEHYPKLPATKEAAMT